MSVSFWIVALSITEPEDDFPLKTIFPHLSFPEPLNVTGLEEEPIAFRVPFTIMDEFFENINSAPGSIVRVTPLLTVTVLFKYHLPPARAASDATV